MEQYWRDHPVPAAQKSSAPDHAPDRPWMYKPNPEGILSDFHRHRMHLAKNNDDSREETWLAELRRYLGVIEPDVTVDTDVVDWWQVCINPSHDGSVTYVVSY